MTNDSTHCVALPETRHLDVLAGLLERRGLTVVRCPMVAIKDSPDDADVVAWIRRFCDAEMGLFIVYTGEGIERLKGFAERAGIADGFVSALAETPLLTRGPKPARVLRGLGIKPAHPALAPTTDGIIATLAQIPIEGKRIGIQLYGAQPLPELVAHIEQRSAEPDPVAPYVYASESDDAAVESLIADIASGRIDAIAFTSKAQVERLSQVVEKTGRALSELLEPIVVAAVGPVAAAELEAAGVTVDAVPESDFFMKPMVAALLQKLPKMGSDPGV